MDECNIKIPEIKDVKALAYYIHENIVPVRNYFRGELPLFFILPDRHGDEMISYHNYHLHVFDLLNKLTGLDFVGLEGMDGIVDKARLDKTILEGEIFPGERDIRKIIIEETAKYPEIKGLCEEMFGHNYESLEDMISNLPLMQLGLRESISCIGLENPELMRKTLSSATMFDYASLLLAVVVGQMFNSGFPKEYWPKYEKEQKEALKKYFMPVYERHPYKEILPDPKKIFESQTPFIIITDHFAKAHDTFQGIERSINAAETAFNKCSETGKNQMAIIYGIGHSEEIAEELRKKNVSYITILDLDSVI